MAESRFVIAAYEAELADDVTLKALAAMIAARARRSRGEEPDPFKQLGRDLSDGG